MKWFTSDTHFGHANIAGPSVSKWPRGYRNFNSVEEMNQAIIKGINKYVAFDDELYHMGDWSFGGHQNTPKYRAMISCRNIHVVKGNHDGNIEQYREFFSSIKDVNVIEVQKKMIFMSHYSHRVWYGSHKGTIHLYGHSHGSIPDHGKSMDVGMDVSYAHFGEYRPFSEDEILEIMSTKQIAFVDNHTPEKNIK